MQKRFVKVNNPFFNNRGGVARREDRRWYAKRRRTGIRVERIGKGAIFKKDKKFLELAKKVNIASDLSQYQYIKLEYIAKPFFIKKVAFIVDLEGKADVYVMDLDNNEGPIRLDVNIYDILKNSYPELRNYKLKKIKFWIEENKHNFINSAKGHKKRKEANAASIEDIFCVENLENYSLGIPNDIRFNKRILSIDDTVLSYKHKFNEEEKMENVFWRHKIRLSSGWHKMSWILTPDAYFNLDYAVLSSEKNNEKTRESPRTDFVKVNPAKYIVHIKDFEEPFWLVFLESFHEGWRAYVNLSIMDQEIKLRWWDRSAIWTWIKTRGMKKLGVHFEVNGYANGWWVDLKEIENQKSRIKNPGELEVIIEFMPQRYYEIGLIIAGFIIIVGFTAILIGFFLKNR